MELDRTYVTFRQEELRAEAAANHLARTASTEKSLATRERRPRARPRLSLRALFVLVLGVALSAAAAAPAQAEKPVRPLGRPATAPAVAPTPTPPLTGTRSAALRPPTSASGSAFGPSVQHFDSRCEPYALTTGEYDGCWLAAMLTHIALEEAWKR